MALFHGNGNSQLMTLFVLVTVVALSHISRTQQRCFGWGHAPLPSM
uniref:Uncharacterized protein n=1 Tax=Anguilla anguilla TaxID=7936 RepID=A0A0E9X1S6_ANGAN